MRYLVLIALLPALAFAGPTYVATWPDRVPVAGGVTFRPTAAQCRAAGYELLANKPAPTAKEIADAKAAANISTAAAISAASNEVVRVSAIKEKYATAMADLCAITGAKASTNGLTVAQIEDICKDAAGKPDEKAIKVNALVNRVLLLGRVMQNEGYDVP